MIKKVSNCFDSIDLFELKNIATILSSRRSEGDIITLSGPLGSGKTQFSKYYIQSVMGELTEVLSPTFTIIQIYEPQTGPEIWHMDFYRIAENQNPYDLDLHQAFTSSVSLIEWPQKLENIIPARTIQIKIEFNQLYEDKRNIEITCSSEKMRTLLQSMY